MKARIVALLLIAACQTGSVPAAPTVTTTETSVTTSTTTTSPATTTSPTSSPTTTRPTTTSSTTTLPAGVTPPPAWLGTRPLPKDDDGRALTLPTPAELVDRRFATTDHLPPPPDDAYHSRVGEVTPEVATRSTWSHDCPVSLDELAYVTVTFRGFDQMPHTGELLVADFVADDVVTVFRRLYEAGFPIEEMKITTPAERDAEPTGDGNPTTAFVCRPVTGGTGWSEHAYGLAIDVNPFHNPYVRGDTVLPELAGAYADRSRELPGMIEEGDAVVQAFDSIGWGWGGRWSSLKDYQHFSLRGR